MVKQLSPWCGRGADAPGFPGSEGGGCFGLALLSCRQGSLGMGRRCCCSARAPQGLALHSGLPGSWQRAPVGTGLMRSFLGEGPCPRGGEVLPCPMGWGMCGGQCCGALGGPTLPLTSSQLSIWGQSHPCRLPSQQLPCSNPHQKLLPCPCLRLHMWGAGPAWPSLSPALGHPARGAGGG